MTSYRAGDAIEINGTTVVLVTRKGAAGIRWNWAARAVDVMGEAYQATAEDAVEDARLTLATGECKHGELGFCTECND